MFNLKELKQKIEKTDDIVECPVNGCKVQVKRMNNRDQKKLYSYIGTEKDKMKEFEKYFCKAHKIYITPTTFIYKYFEDNSLWYDDGDKALLKGIFKVKRIKSQLFHHNSEDAVTWNVFRFLEKTNLLSGFLTNLQNSSIKNQEIIYWSYAQSQKGLWDMLEKARKEFELVPSKGSEPDLIILCRNILLIIEAKLMDKNENGAKPRVEDKYVNGGQRWWDEVFCSDFKTVAIKEKKYIFGLENIHDWSGLKLFHSGQ